MTLDLSQTYIQKKSEHGSPGDPFVGCYLGPPRVVEGDLGGVWTTLHEKENVNIAQKFPRSIGRAGK